GKCVIVVPVSMVVRCTDILLVRMAVIVARPLGQRIVDAYETICPVGLVSDRDHHVAATGGPSPGEREGPAPGIDLRLYLVPTERLTAFERRLEPVGLEMRPPTLDTSPWRAVTATIIELELVVRLLALAHVPVEEIQDHLTAGRPTPVGRQLGIKGYWH